MSDRLIEVTMHVDAVDYVTGKYLGSRYADIVATVPDHPNASIDLAIEQLTGVLAEKIKEESR